MVLAIVLLVALSLMLAMYILAITRLSEAMNLIKEVASSRMTSIRERLSITYASLSVAIGKDITYADLEVEIHNVGSVSTAITNSVVYTCLDSSGRVKYANITYLPKVYSLQPGGYADIVLSLLIPYACRGLTVTFVTIYGNSYTVAASW